MEAAEPEFAAGREAETTAAQHRARLDELERIERETLPATEARLAELRTLEAELAAAGEARSALQHAQQMQRVAELDTRLTQLDQLMPALSAHEAAQRELVLMQEAHRLARAEEAARAAMAEHQAAFTQADGDARVAQQAVDQANLRDILAYWVRLKEIEALKRGEHQIAEITVRRDALSARAMRLHRREQVMSLLAMVGALIALATAFGGFHYNDFRYWIGTAVAVVLVWLFPLRGQVARHRAPPDTREHPQRGGQSARRLDRGFAASRGGSGFS